MEGDSRAQQELYKLYYKAMYNTSLRIIKDEMEAEDIMQDSFLTAFEKITKYKGEVSFGAWLKKIVVNNSLDALKKRKNIHISTDEHQVDIKEEIPKDNSEENEIRVEQIKRAISNLADGYRIILSLYLFEGYDHEEISEILNISSSTSRSQFTRAKRKLLDQIEMDKIKEIS